MLRPGTTGVLGSSLPWGESRPGWDFVCTRHGEVAWEDAFRALDAVAYTGPISFECEDAGIEWPARRVRGGRIRPLRAVEAPGDVLRRGLLRPGPHDAGPGLSRMAGRLAGKIAVITGTAGVRPVPPHCLSR